MEKQNLVLKIPSIFSNIESKKKKQIQEINILIENLLNKKEKLGQATNLIFKMLRDDNYAILFLKVIKNRATQGSIFNEKKLEYDEKFNQMEELSENTKQIKRQIFDKIGLFNQTNIYASKLEDEDKQVYF